MTVRLGLVGILGDVHAEDRRLEVALKALARRKVGHVLCVGDVADGQGDLDRTITLLRDAGVLAVGGNHDRWWLEGSNREVPAPSPPDALSDAARAWLAALPATRRFDSARGRVLLCHGLGADDLGEVRPEDVGPALDHNASLQAQLAAGDADVLVNGHSHRRMLRRIGPLVILNAGTLHRRCPAGFVIADLDAGQVELHDVDEDGASLASTLSWPAPRN